MWRCGGRRPRGLGGHARGRNCRGRRCLGGRTAAGWRGRAVLRGTLDEAGRLGAGREGRGAVGSVGGRLPGDAVPTGWASRPLGEACPRRGDPGTGPTALFVRSTRLGPGLSFTRSSLSAGPPTTEPRPQARLLPSRPRPRTRLTHTRPRPRTQLTHTRPRPRARLTPTGPYRRPGPSTTAPRRQVPLIHTMSRLRPGRSIIGSSLSAGPPTTDPRPRTRLPTAPRLRAEPSLAGRFLEGQPSAPRAVPDRARRRGEAVVQGVRGRCGARVVGGVVQLPPPVVLVTATGGCSPLLAHAPNCPPHGRYENGASRKSSPVPRIELCCERVAGRFHPPTGEPPGDAE